MKHSNKNGPSLMSLSPHIAIIPLSSSTNSRLISRDVEELRAEAGPIILVGERLLTAEAMRLLMRLHRRWGKDDPPPLLPLGTLRRRYHANLARYLYSVRKDY